MTRIELSSWHAGKKNGMYGKHHTEESKKLMSQRRTKNYVGNKGLHMWLRRHIPQPELCEHCNEKPSRDLANITGVYNRDFNNWKYLCKKCHVKYDDTVNKGWITKRKRIEV